MERTMSINMTFKGKDFSLPEEIDIENKEGLIKLGLFRNGIAENIWAVIHPNDINDYENDVHDIHYTRVCVLANHAICGIPWGAYIPYKLNGKERPIAVFEDIIDIENDQVYFSEKAHKQYQEMESSDE